MQDPFAKFTHEAFRIELLPHYRNEDGADSTGFTAWVAGQPLPPDFNADWESTVKAAISRGAVVRRLRLVSEPLTAYEAYEIEAGYQVGRAAGEDIRVVRREDFPGAVDAWFFDEVQTRLQRADADGSFRGVEDRQLDASDLTILQRAKVLFINARTAAD